MNDLCKTELFSLLTKNSQTVTNHEMQHIYETFVKEVIALNQPQRDYTSIFREFNQTCIEFQSLQKQILYEQGEKCPKSSVLSENYLVSSIRN